ncbi:hypothetical protein [Zoogloea sp.]|uniref:hypothetical protein n=1 Tax=Zoogloea sp. TaxID=49181 RepID=UPI00141620CC|nr:MAG: hypothetical protein F9K15_12645 [Zoogloea sp.]
MNWIDAISKEFVNSPLRIFPPLLLVLCGCASSGESLSSSVYREVGWLTGEQATQVALLDAVDHALSLSINGEDFHSYQIKKRRMNGRSYFEQATKPVSGRDAGQLCLENDDVNAWEQLGCRAVVADPDPSDTSCQLSARCMKVRIAPFVLGKRESMAVVESALLEPCRFVPDYAELKRKHGINKPRGGTTRLGADVSRYWLFCSSGKKVSATLERTNTEGHLLLTWFR